jgi:hypothetical protein
VGSTRIRNRRGIWRCALASTAIALAAPDAAVAMADAASASATARSTPAQHPHRFGFGLHLGYGLGIAPRDRQRGRDVADVRFVAVSPHVRVLLAQPGADERWYHGDLDGIVEATFLIETEPASGWAGGVNFNLRYRFLRHHRLQPYVEGGVGVGSLSFGLADQDDGVSFFLQGGAGARWRIDDRFSLIGSVRWHHISNAQLRQPNNGIDSVLFVVGLELW